MLFKTNINTFSLHYFSISLLILLKGPPRTASSFEWQHRCKFNFYNFLTVIASNYYIYLLYLVSVCHLKVQKYIGHYMKTFVYLFLFSSFWRQFPRGYRISFFIIYTAWYCHPPLYCASLDVEFNFTSNEIKFKAIEANLHEIFTKNRNCCFF